MISTVWYSTRSSSVRLKASSATEKCGVTLNEADARGLGLAANTGAVGSPPSRGRYATVNCRCAS
jgi:hypothetical protein